MPRVLPAPLTDFDRRMDETIAGQALNMPALPWRPYMLRRRVVRAAPAASASSGSVVLSLLAARVESMCPREQSFTEPPAGGPPRVVPIAGRCVLELIRLRGGAFATVLQRADRDAAGITQAVSSAKAVWKCVAGADAGLRSAVIAQFVAASVAFGSGEEDDNGRAPLELAWLTALPCLFMTTLSKTYASRMTSVISAAILDLARKSGRLVGEAGAVSEAAPTHVQDASLRALLHVCRVCPEAITDRTTARAVLQCLAAVLESPPAATTPGSHPDGLDNVLAVALGAGTIATGTAGLSRRTPTAGTNVQVTSGSTFSQAAGLVKKAVAVLVDRVSGSEEAHVHRLAALVRCSHLAGTVQQMQKARVSAKASLTTADAREGDTTMIPTADLTKLCCSVLAVHNVVVTRAANAQPYSINEHRPTVIEGPDALYLAARGLEEAQWMAAELLLACHYVLETLRCKPLWPCAAPESAGEDAVCFTPTRGGGRLTPDPAMALVSGALRTVGCVVHAVVRDDERRRAAADTRRVQEEYRQMVGLAQGQSWAAVLQESTMPSESPHDGTRRPEIQLVYRWAVWAEIANLLPVVGCSNKALILRALTIADRLTPACANRNGLMMHAATMAHVEAGRSHAQQLVKGLDVAPLDPTSS
jgi:hypothetical protein